MLSCTDIPAGISSEDISMSIMQSCNAEVSKIEVINHDGVPYSLLFNGNSLSSILTSSRLDTDSISCIGQFDSDMQCLAAQYTGISYDDGQFSTSISSRD